MVRAQGRGESEVSDQGARLERVAQFATRSFESDRDAVEAALRLVSELLGLRTAFVTSTEHNRFQILALYNAGGSDISVGPPRPLDDTY